MTGTEVADERFRTFVAAHLGTCYANAIAEAQGDFATRFAVGKVGDTETYRCRECGQTLEITIRRMGGTR